MPVLLTLGNDHQKNCLSSNSHGDFLKDKHFSISYWPVGFHILLMGLVLRNKLYYAWVLANSVPSSNSCIFPHPLSFFFSSMSCLFPSLSLGAFHVHHMEHSILMENLESSSSSPIVEMVKLRLSKSEMYAHISSCHIITLCFICLYLSTFIKGEPLSKVYSVTLAIYLSIFLM